MRLFFFLLFAPYLLIGQPTAVPASWDQQETLRRLQKHVDVLTADSIEGRFIGTAGQWRAARYIARLFEEYHLLPCGDSGSYFQKFEVERKEVLPSSRLVVRNSATQYLFQWQEDFITPDIVDDTLSGTLLWGGMLSQTFLTTKDTSFKNAHGVILFTLSEETALSFLQSRSEFLAAVRSLAPMSVAIVLTIPQNEKVYNALAEEIPARMKQQISLPSSSQAVLPPVFFLSPETFETLRTMMNGLTSQAKNGAVSFPGIHISFFCICAYERISTCNVVGMIPGADSLAGREYIAITAHHDHLGKIDSSSYYPGADDNASGTAVLLELVRTFSRSPIKPSRSILFLSFTGEEKGLLGSTYYVSHPTVPLNNFYALLNIDMIGRKDDYHPSSQYIYVIGSDAISVRLDSLLQSANAESVQFSLDYRYNDKHHPLQLYYRSDHAPFVRHGIPSVFFFGGFHQDYHQKTDTKEKLLFSKMERLTYVLFQLTSKLGSFPLPLVP